MRFAFAWFGFATCVAACGWDWTVRSTSPDASDASSANDSGSGDAASTTDASAPDASGADGSSCSALLADVASTKAKAITCTLGSVSDCVGLVDDECGCGIFVGQSGSTASQNFASAVASAKGAGCTDQCVGCTALPARGTCVESGASFTCSPP